MSFQHWQDISFYLSEIDKEKTRCAQGEITPESLEGTRKKIAHFLEQLKGELDSKLQKEAVGLILFALVAGIDEQMQGLDYTHLKTRWTPLQKEFYAAYTAGELFFKTIDDILDQPEIPSLVYEVFYYVLKRGFQGKYKDSKTQLQKYLQLLKEKIPVEQPSGKLAELESIVPVEQKRKAWHLYTASVGLSALFFIGLYLLSSHV